MKIKKIIIGCEFNEKDKIIFDTGDYITYGHTQDCCEENFAEFESIKNDVYIDRDFEKPLDFEFVDNMGFKFGNPGKMIFVPCYSVQNGYYTTAINIYFNKEKVLSGLCEEKNYYENWKNFREPHECNFEESLEEYDNR